MPGLINSVPILELLWRVGNSYQVFTKRRVGNLYSISNDPFMTIDRKVFYLIRRGAILTTIWSERIGVGDDPELLQKLNFIEMRASPHSGGH